jgi:hypothetical protein
MERSWETALPTLNDWFSAEELKSIRSKYEEFQIKFRELWDSKQIIEYVSNPENKTLYDL